MFVHDKLNSNSKLSSDTEKIQQIDLWRGEGMEFLIDNLEHFLYDSFDNLIQGMMMLWWEAGEAWLEPMSCAFQGSESKAHCFL